MKKARFRPFALLAMIGLLVGCATFGQESSWNPRDQNVRQDHQEHLKVLGAQIDGKTPGALVLATAEQMLQKGVVVVGSCWDYLNAVYLRVGFTDARLVRIFSKPFEGPFADIALIQKGDWIMYQNLSFGGIDHSAIFVAWVDFDRSRALTISYVGQNRNVPGRLFEYDLSRTYRVLRPRL